jgi:phage portal protein BeeE
MLLGIPGDNTYSNYQEATRAFWRQTVLPLVHRTAQALSGWLGPAFGGGLELKPDLDGVAALVPERGAVGAAQCGEFLDAEREARGGGIAP